MQFEQQIHLRNSTNTSYPFYTYPVSPRHTHNNKYKYRQIQILQIPAVQLIRILYHLDTPTSLLQGSDVAIDRTVAGHLQGIQRQISAKSRTYNQNIKLLLSDYTVQSFKGNAVSHEDKKGFCN